MRQTERNLTMTWWKNNLSKKLEEEHKHLNEDVVLAATEAATQRFSRGMATLHR